MPLNLVTLTFPHVNTSLQRGDFVYYVSTTLTGTNNSIKNFDKGEYGNIIKWAIVSEVRRNVNPPEVEVIWDDAVCSLPTTDDFILFSKNKENNTTSLVGYFASVNFINNANTKVELFSIASEITESSK